MLICRATFLSLQIFFLHYLLSLVHAQDDEWPYQSFETEPSFQPPYLDVRRISEPAPGYLFLAPAAKAHQTAPLIMTDASELIWHGQNYNSAFNFGVQRYRGQQVLVYWNGTIFPEPIGRGYGSVVLLNNAYSPIANATLPGNFITSTGESYPTNIDLHEIFITNRNTMLVTANNVTQTDLSAVGGSENGWIVDCLVYEIDIESGEVLFQWSALDHISEIPLTSSVYPLGTEGFTGENQTVAWGYFHINAVAPLNDGFIVSSRYLCSIIALDRHGHVLWRLSGRDGADFALDPNANFCYQHDIRPVYTDPQHYTTQSNLTVHLHDNANCPTNNGTTPTSGLRLHIDTRARHVSLGRRYQNQQDPLFAPAQGNYQHISSHDHVFLGHGFIPYLEEYSGDGKIVETIQFGSGIGTISYRAFRQEWIGCPSQRPQVKIINHQDVDKLVVFMSWNGATEYDSWKIKGPDSNGTIHTLKTVLKTGFETNTTISHVPWIQVEAIASAENCKCENINEVGKSGVIRTPRV